MTETEVLFRFEGLADIEPKTNPFLIKRDRWTDECVVSWSEMGEPQQQTVYWKQVTPDFWTNIARHMLALFSDKLPTGLDYALWNWIAVGGEVDTVSLLQTMGDYEGVESPIMDFVRSLLQAQLTTASDKKIESMLDAVSTANVLLRIEDETFDTVLVMLELLEELSHIESEDPETYAEVMKVLEGKTLPMENVESPDKVLPKPVQKKMLEVAQASFVRRKGFYVFQRIDSLLSNAMFALALWSAYPCTTLNGLMERDR